MSDNQRLELPNDPDGDAFHRKWGELSRYNGRKTGGETFPPEYKAKMLRQQAAYNRLLANDLDLITEKPREPKTHYANGDMMLEQASNMEKEADEIMEAIREKND